MLKMGTDVKKGNTVEADICIIGSGPAAFALALPFVDQQGEGRPRKVVMLESSAPSFHHPTAYGIDQLNQTCDVEELYRGKVAGLLSDRSPDYLRRGRQRMYGGTSNHWGGWSWPLEAHNLEPGGAVDVGWPISFSELQTYYQRTVRRVMRLPAAEFDNPQYWIDRLPSFGLETMPLEGTPLKTRILQFHQIAFQREFGHAIELSPHVDLYRNANALSFTTRYRGHEQEVHRLEVRSLTNDCVPEDPWFVEAQSFVIATGGIEATRILLLNELGDSTGQLGLTFMDHPYLWVAAQFDLTLSIPAGIREFYFRAQRLPAPGGRSKLIAGLVPRPEFLQQEEIADFRILLGGFGTGFLNVNTEPIPDPESRITLATPEEMPRDVFGQRRVKVDWQSPLEPQTRTMRTLIDVAGDVLGDLGYVSNYRAADPEYRSKLWPDWCNPEGGFGVGPGLHPMGTTRMSKDPKSGVVDADLRVFGTTNLYVSSSSTFPRGGYQNPTFTVCALSERLADHLKEVLI